MRRLLSWLLCLLSPLLAFAQRPPMMGPPPKARTEGITRKWLDVPYAQGSEAQKLDIYLPETGDGPFPLIISIHGGAFKGGDKADGQLNPMLDGLKRGYAVASVNYRLSGEALFPNNIQDIKAAIRFLRANAQQYHLDPDRFVAWGGSAGGNLAALAGTSAAVTELEDLSQGNADQSSAVQAVVDFFGPINFLAMDEQFKASGKGQANHSEAGSPESLVLGAALATVPEKVKQASPATYIGPNTPPFFIAHGDQDQLVPTQQSIDFAKQLQEQLGKQRVELEIIPGAKHGGPAFENKKLLDQVFKFLDKQLGVKR